MGDSGREMVGEEIDRTNEGQPWGVAEVMRVITGGVSGTHGLTCTRFGEWGARELLDKRVQPPGRSRHTVGEGVEFVMIALDERHT